MVSGRVRTVRYDSKRGRFTNRDQMPSVRRYEFKRPRPDVRKNFQDEDDSEFARLADLATRGYDEAHGIGRPVYSPISPYSPEEPDHEGGFADPQGGEGEEGVEGSSIGGRAQNSGIAGDITIPRDPRIFSPLGPIRYHKRFMLRLPVRKVSNLLDENEAIVARMSGLYNTNTFAGEMYFTPKEEDWLREFPSWVRIEEISQVCHVIGVTNPFSTNNSGVEGTLSNMIAQVWSGTGANHRTLGVPGRIIQGDLEPVISQVTDLNTDTAKLADILYDGAFSASYGYTTWDYANITSIIASKPNNVLYDLESVEQAMRNPKRFSYKFAPGDGYIRRPTLNGFTGPRTMHINNTTTCPASLSSNPTVNADQKYNTLQNNYSANALPSNNSYGMNLNACVGMNGSHTPHVIPDMEIGLVPIPTTDALKTARQVLYCILDTYATVTLGSPQAKVIDSTTSIGATYADYMGFMDAPDQLHFTTYANGDLQVFRYGYKESGDKPTTRMDSPNDVKPTTLEDIWPSVPKTKVNPRNLL